MEQTRAQGVARQVLERVYIRALREYYGMLNDVHATLYPSLSDTASNLQPLAGGRSSLGPYIVTAPQAKTLRQHSDWQVKLNLAELDGEILPPKVETASTNLLFDITDEDMRMGVRISVDAWITGLLADMGFHDVQYRISKSIEGTIPRPTMEVFNDFLFPELAISFEATNIRQSFYNPFVPLLLALISGLVMAMLLMFAYRRQRAEEALDMSLHREEGLTTQLERASEHMQSADRLASLGEMAAGITHEIYNPIAYIESNLDGLREDLAALTEFIQIIDHASDHLDIHSSFYQELLVAYQRLQIQDTCMLAPQRLQDCIDGIIRVDQIVRDMKKLSRHSSSEKRICDVNSDLNSVINIARSRINSNTTLDINLIECPPIVCSPSQIAQVVMNLLVNAIQALGDDGGIIRLSEEIVDYQLKISVSDTGSGMTPELASRIFEPFFTTKPDDQGTGMGLALCYKLIQEHNGDIELTTEVGHGSCFTVVLPMNHGDT
jgi:signal transduction histidine kinase|tara:strand:- start:477 stop:1958 length:1482 start_codon:yes stop_codon:yes gene_type:complete